MIWIEFLNLYEFDTILVFLAVLGYILQFY